MDVKKAYFIENDVLIDKKNIIATARHLKSFSSFHKTRHLKNIEENILDETVRNKGAYETGKLNFLYGAAHFVIDDFKGFDSSLGQQEESFSLAITFFIKAGVTPNNALTLLYELQDFFSDKKRRKY